MPSTQAAIEAIVFSDDVLPVEQGFHPLTLSKDEVPFELIACELEKGKTCKSITLKWIQENGYKSFHLLRYDPTSKIGVFESNNEANGRYPVVVLTKNHMTLLHSTSGRTIRMNNFNPFTLPRAGMIKFETLTVSDQRRDVTKLWSSGWTLFDYTNDYFGQGLLIPLRDQEEASLAELQNDGLFVRKVTKSKRKRSFCVFKVVSDANPRGGYYNLHVR